MVHCQNSASPIRGHGWTMERILSLSPRRIGRRSPQKNWVCPTFYTWRFYRVVRLTRPTVLREPYGAKSNLPSACSPPLGGGTLVLCLAGMSGRLSIIVLCRYPLRHVSHGKPTVVKGG